MKLEGRMLKHLGKFELSQFPEEKESKSDELRKPIIGLRWILAILGFFLFFNMFYQKTGFSVALVAMVNNTESTKDFNKTSCNDFNTNFCNDLNGTSCNDICVSQDNLDMDNTGSDLKMDGGEYNWTNAEQGWILGGFFWGFVFSRLIGGRASEIIGQRAVIGAGVGLSGLLVYLTPYIASMSPYVMVGNRFIIGALYGPMTCAFHSLLSAWAPRNELSFMVTVGYAGSLFGATVGLIVTGWLQESFGWRASFWIGGAVNTTFLPFWFIFVRNSPKEHPWLSTYEKKLLDENKYVTVKWLMPLFQLDKPKSIVEKSVPWMKLITSPYLHLCILSHFSKTYFDTMLAAEGPLFFTSQMGLELSTSSYICGIQFLISAFFVLVHGRLSDLIIERKWVSKITTRKLFNILGQGISALLLLGVIFAESNSTIVIALWILIGATADATACGYYVSPIDVAPNFTATFVGIMALGNCGSAVAPIIVSEFLEQDNGWNKSFYLTIGINIVSCIFYAAYMTAEPQPWNFCEEEEESQQKKDSNQNQITTA